MNKRTPTEASDTLVDPHAPRSPRPAPASPPTSSPPSTLAQWGSAPPAPPSHDPGTAPTVVPTTASGPRLSARDSRGPRTVLPEIQGMDALQPRDEPRYELRGTLGQGGMGEVLLAYDRDIEREVAMKRIHADLLDAGFVVRFAQEVRALGRLEHPNVLPIYDVGLDEGGELYFTMKYIQGETLEDVLERLRARDPATLARYPLSRRLDIFIDILSALEHAHALGVIHRDVKPENIMIGPSGDVLLVDWGVAHLLSGALEAGVAGTPAYMAPEQALGAPPDARSDVYSAFVVLYELLTLRTYHDHEAGLTTLLAEVAKKEPPAPFSPLWSDVYPTPVPAQYRHFLIHGLANKPNDRFDSARSSLDLLARVRSGDFAVQCPATLMRRAHTRSLRFIERYPVTFMATMGVAVLMMVGGALWSALS